MPGDQGKDQGFHQKKRQEMLDGEVPSMGGDNDPYLRGVPHSQTVPEKEGEYKKGGD